MKAITKTFISLIIVTVSWVSLFAQEVYSTDTIKVSEEIATGHVFVDGKYIESPYVLRREGWKIFINGNLVFDYQKPRSPFNFTEKPKANFDELDESSGLSDIFKVKDTVYNKPLANVISFYYLEKYEYSVACDSIVELYKSLPNILSFTKYLGQDDTFEMISYNNETRVLSMQSFGKKHNENFGPTQNPKIETGINSRVNYCFEDYCRDLNLNRILIFITNNERDAGFLRIRISTNEIKDFCNILLSENDQQYKVDLLCKIVIDRASAEKIIETFIDSSIIVKILEQTINKN